MELEDTAMLAKLAFAPTLETKYHHKSDSDAHLHGITFCTKSRSLMQHIKQAAYQSNYWKRLYLPNRGTSQSSRLGMEEGVGNHCGPLFQKHYRHAMN